MIIKITSDSEIYEWREVRFKELEIEDCKYRFTVRRYPKNTVVMIHTGCISKKLFKEPHYEADKNFPYMLDYMNNRYGLGLSGLEFDSILHSYQQMKNMKT